MTDHELAQQAVQDLWERKGRVGKVRVVVVDTRQSHEITPVQSKPVVVWLVGTPWSVGRQYDRYAQWADSVLVTSAEAYRRLAQGAKLWFFDVIPAPVLHYPSPYLAGRVRWKWGMMLGRTEARIRQWLRRTST